MNTYGTANVTRPSRLQIRCRTSLFARGEDAHAYIGAAARIKCIGRAAGNLKDAWQTPHNDAASLNGSTNEDGARTSPLLHHLDIFHWEWRARTSNVPSRNKPLYKPQWIHAPCRTSVNALNNPSRIHSRPNIPPSVWTYASRPLTGYHRCP